ncbi:hypothetical protein Ocin01_14666 [Orchesella cincta]|uniref:Uncharacterized protein n=1 Tax=Orchesella cincta TaxID=48709 RepID=A0A1D2MGB4_ORCCI|nr:hypothetical protein Ocin01_14666 [Orchesella cincta]
MCKFSSVSSVKVHKLNLKHTLPFFSSIIYLKYTKMAVAKQLTVVLKLLIFSDLLLACTASTVAFYKKENFTGAIYKTNTSKECQELPVLFQGVDGSIKTTGCTVVYPEKEKSGSCEMYGFIPRKIEKRLGQLSLQYPFDKISDIYNTPLTVHSFRECMAKESQPEIDVDFYDDNGSKHEFYDICTCTNLPSLDQMKESKGTAHGKCLKFYQTSNCEGVPSHYVYTTVFSGYQSLQWKSMEPCDMPMSEGCKSTVHFFTEKYFKGARKVVKSSTTCQQLAEPLPSSVKTTGCIALFEDECVVNDLFTGYIVKSKKGDLEELTREYSLNAKGFRPNFFRGCTQMEAKHSHDFDYQESVELDGNEVRYDKIELRDVCECKNLQATFPVENRVQRIHTYGNCFKLYTTLDCDGVPSITDVRLEISTVGSTMEFQSIEPCNTPKTCMRFNALVFKMQPLLAKSEFAGNEIDFPMATAQTFINHGLATIEQDYEARKELTETASFEFSPGFREMSVIGFEMRSQTSFGGGLPFVSTAINKIQATLKNEWKHDKTAENQFRKEVSETKVFAVSQKINIKACMKYEASSVIRMVQDVIVDYKILFEITASTSAGTAATAEEITDALGKQNNTHLTIFQGHPRSTKYKVVAQSFAKLLAMYGKNSMFLGNGGPISECNSNRG